MIAPSCYLIGADTLLRECAATLRRRGWQIHGIVTADPRLADWTAAAGIDRLDPRSDYATVLARSSFDFLFSIGHLAVLPAAVLQLPRKGAINFHDGPLPRYAGLNTPTWALIEGAREYGITWHLVTAELDRGDILDQVLFPIDAGETSLSLNTKCFEAGLESFANLIDRAASGSLFPRPQASAEFRYYGRSLRPARACLLDWHRPASELARLVRALDFGTYPNPVGSAKIMLRDRAFVVKRARALDGFGPAGTLLSCDDDELVVASAEGVLAISALATPSGESISPSAAVRQAGAAAGDRLDLWPSSRAAELAALDEEIARNEPFWCLRLAGFSGTSAPLATAAESNGSYRVRTIAIPADLRTGADGGAASAIIAAFAAFVARVNGERTFAAGYSHAELRRRIGGLTPILTNQLPMTVAIPHEAKLADLAALMARERARLARHGGWLPDVVGRQPQLLSQGLLGHDRPFAVALAADPDFQPGGANLLALRLGEGCELLFREDAYDPAAATALQAGFQAFLSHLAARPADPLRRVPLLDEETRTRLLTDWNDTAEERPYEEPILRRLEERAAREPNRIAVSQDGRSLDYAALEAGANQLAQALCRRGVGPDHLVGLYLSRRLELPLAMIAVSKAGAAWLPLDPTWPAQRLAAMIEDAGIAILVCHGDDRGDLPISDAQVICVDSPEVASQPATPPPLRARPANLAYVIFTSGSTGRPKGVMVSRRNLANFFSAMDALVAHDPPGVWLAVTSFAFDIAILELLWTLARGFHVVLLQPPGATHGRKRPLAFSLFYFSSDEGSQVRDKYRLLLEGARFADAHDFAAVWTPERHFNAFGGLFPDPSVTGAAVAAITSKVQVRAGSVVLPLNHPIRVAEAWSIVDNISGGRVGISLASGWSPDDFVLRPETFKDAKKILFEELEILRRLWRGESVAFPGPQGTPVAVRTLPRPIQPELPVWITAAGNPETYRMAGACGANLLTHLLGQSIDLLAPKLAAYREARAQAGYDPATGIVSLMLHTFVAEDDGTARALVKEPLKQYLRSTFDLLKDQAWAFPAFKRPAHIRDDPGDDFAGLSEEERDAILEGAFHRYFDGSGLFGSRETCLAQVARVRAIGVDEIACLIDFGVAEDRVLAHLPLLDEVRREANAVARQPGHDVAGMAELVAAHGVTHLQCTPSMARLFLADEASRAALARIPNLLIGGEAFSAALYRELRAAGTAEPRNMYGPTETTIWSASAAAIAHEATLPIGRPIANTRIYLLDDQGELTLPGMAGQLAIGGAGVCRGYLGRPDLTAERFVPDPFATAPGGGTLYLTGDLARQDAEGILHFLGRGDHQIKLRGYRIELGEIEARLNQHPQVRECVVVSRDDGQGDAILAAYLVAREGAVPEAVSLRELLRNQLPDYMIPAHFVVLASFPLTPNGKIDRLALPEPHTSAAQAKTAYAPPENETEKKIVALWSELLGRERVGVDDNFFDIGGHSLLVVRMHRRLERLLEQPVILTDLYQHTTIRKLTAYLEKGEEASTNLVKSAERARLRRESRGRRR